MRQVPQFKKSNMGSYVLALYVGLSDGSVCD